jgi:hypothetical protein
MIVAASTTLLADSRTGGHGGFLPYSASPYVDMTVSAESSMSTDMPLDLRGRGFGTQTTDCGCWSRPPASASKLSPHPLSTGWNSLTTFPVGPASKQV